MSVHDVGEYHGGKNAMEKYVGERIRRARNAKKMSQEGLAEIVDVRRQTIGEYEQGILRGGAI